MYAEFFFISYRHFIIGITTYIIQFQIYRPLGNEMNSTTGWYYQCCRTNSTTNAQIKPMKIEHYTLGAQNNNVFWTNQQLPWCGQVHSAQRTVRCPLCWRRPLWTGRQCPSWAWWVHARSWLPCHWLPVSSQHQSLDDSGSRSWWSPYHHCLPAQSSAEPTKCPEHRWTSAFLVYLVNLKTEGWVAISASGWLIEHIQWLLCNWLLTNCNDCSLVEQSVFVEHSITDTVSM